MDRYLVHLSDPAKQDLASIYQYIASQLQEPGVALAQVNRIRTRIRALDRFPHRNQQVEWEPWLSAGMRRMPVDNFGVFYMPDDERGTVTITRILYGKRDIRHHIRSDQ